MDISDLIKILLNVNMVLQIFYLKFTHMTVGYLTICCLEYSNIIHL